MSKHGYIRVVAALAVGLAGTFGGGLLSAAAERSAANMGEVRSAGKIAHELNSFDAMGHQATMAAERFTVSTTSTGVYSVGRNPTAYANRLIISASGNANFDSSAGNESAVLVEGGALVNRYGRK